MRITGINEYGQVIVDGEGEVVYVKSPMDSPVEPRNFTKVFPFDKTVGPMRITIVVNPYRPLQYPIRVSIVPDVRIDFNTKLGLDKDGNKVEGCLLSVNDARLLVGVLLDAIDEVQEKKG